jgi:hypothetical protein
MSFQLETFSEGVDEGNCFRYLIKAGSRAACYVEKGLFEV